jgi:plastocyanin
MPQLSLSTWFVALLLLSFAAFGLVAVPIAARAGASADEVTVTIDNFTFAPKALTVAKGTRVTWLNRDDIPHTIVSNSSPKRFKSPPLDTGDKFALTFDQSGTYEYFCSIHPMMTATVTVR